VVSIGLRNKAPLRVKAVEPREPIARPALGERVHRLAVGALLAMDLAQVGDSEAGMGLEQTQGVAPLDRTVLPGVNIAILLDTYRRRTTYIKYPSIHKDGITLQRFSQELITIGTFDRRLSPLYYSW